MVLLDPTTDAGPRFFQAAIFRGPDFFSLQAAMEPFDVAVAYRVIIRRPSVRDPEPSQCSQKARRSELGSTVGRERHVRCTACSTATWGIFGSATVREIPSHNLPRATVGRP